MIFTNNLDFIQLFHPNNESLNLSNIVCHLIGFIYSIILIIIIIFDLDLSLIFVHNVSWQSLHNVLMYSLEFLSVFFSYHALGIAEDDLYRF